MTITITDEMVVAYSQCPRKAYLLMYSEERGQPHEYQQILEQNRLTNQYNHLNVLRHEPNVYLYSAENLKKGCDPLITARLIADGHRRRLGAHGSDGQKHVGQYRVEIELCLSHYTTHRQRRHHTCRLATCGDLSNVACGQGRHCRIYPE